SPPASRRWVGSRDGRSTEQATEECHGSSVVTGAVAYGRARCETEPVYDYDILVLGSGPGGQKAAIAAAKLDRRVAVVERRHMIGGVCINTGTIPSKTLREAVLYLTGLNQREMYGQSYRVKDDITIADLTSRTQHVV